MTYKVVPFTIFGMTYTSRTSPGELSRSSPTGDIMNATLAFFIVLMTAVLTGIGLVLSYI